MPALPCLSWLREYRGTTLLADGVAAAIVTVMLIPQSLAYALLAGLPAETGLYASILPLVAYAIFGSSRTLAVGPVAVASLMTAAAIAKQDVLPPLEAAMWLALISGAFLFVLGLLRCGFIANFISHPVVAGFMTASGILIALGQVRHLLGISGSGETLPELLSSLAAELPNTHGTTLALGIGILALLFWTRRSMSRFLQLLGAGKALADTLARLGPMLAVLLTTFIAWYFRLDERGVALLGSIPAALPSLGIPDYDQAAVSTLLVPALLIATIGYVESMAVGRTLATRRRQKVDPNQELVALGAANLASGFSGAFPVTGGFSRSVVNFEAGAETPLAGVLTAVGMMLAAWYLSDLLAWLPQATLAATIIVAVLPLVDFHPLFEAWRYSRSDFAAAALTMGVTLLLGVELGVSCGVAASLLLHLYRTSQPHIAEVGEIAGTEHFRNVARHPVVTHPDILSLRVDESLYFANASYIEDYILQALRQRPGVRHVVLMCSAVNCIDFSALEVLEGLNARLRQAGIGLHLSEVKGPVMDQLHRSDFLEELNGQVFLSQHQAVATLTASPQPSTVH